MQEHDQHEWGPWIEHDGRRCPCVGQFVHVRLNRKPDYWQFYEPMPNGLEYMGIAMDGPAWGREGAHIGNPVLAVRYRIRKPRGLTMLEEIANQRRPVEEVRA